MYFEERLSNWLSLLLEFLDQVSLTALLQSKGKHCPGVYMCFTTRSFLIIFPF